MFFYHYQFELLSNCISYETFISDNTSVLVKPECSIDTQTLLLAKSETDLDRGGRAEQVQVVVKKLFFFSLKLLLKTVFSIFW